MSFKKYLWKCRLLVINTPNYSHPEYKRSKDLYQKEIKGYHKTVSYTHLRAHET